MEEAKARNKQVAMEWSVFRFKAIFYLSKDEFPLNHVLDIPEFS